MRQLCLIILLIYNIPVSAIAQQTAFQWREKERDKYVGINLSASRYCGDLSERYNFSHLQLSWSVEGHFRYRFSEKLSARGDLGVYHIRADQRFTKYKTNYLSFSATNFSSTVGIDWDLREVGTAGNLHNIIYLLAEIGITRLAPGAVLDGLTYSLPAFQTEGKRYPLWVAQLNYGMGIPFTLSRVTQVQIEARYTHIFSDYVDDVSGYYVSKAGASSIEKRLADRRIDEGVIPQAVDAQRGNPTKNDGYFLFTLQFVHKFH